MYVNVKLECKLVLKQPSDSTIEYILLKIHNKSHRRTLLGCIYRTNRTIDYGSLLNVVSDISLEYTDIILADNFNSNLLSENPTRGYLKIPTLYSVNETIPTPCCTVIHYLTYFLSITLVKSYIMTRFL